MLPRGVGTSPDACAGSSSGTVTGKGVLPSWQCELCTRWESNSRHYTRFQRFSNTVLRTFERPGIARDGKREQAAVALFRPSLRVLTARDGKRETP